MMGLTLTDSAAPACQVRDHRELLRARAIERALGKGKARAWFDALDTAHRAELVRRLFQKQEGGLRSTWRWVAAVQAGAGRPAPSEDALRRFSDCAQAAYREVKRAAEDSGELQLVRSVPIPEAARQLDRTPEQIAELVNAGKLERITQMGVVEVTSASLMAMWAETLPARVDRRLDALAKRVRELDAARKGQRVK